MTDHKISQVGSNFVVFDLMSAIINICLFEIAEACLFDVLCLIRLRDMLIICLKPCQRSLILICFRSI